jgi:hypothetical protein
MKENREKMNEEVLCALHLSHICKRMENFTEEIVVVNSKLIMLPTSEFYMALNFAPPLLYSTMDFLKFRINKLTVKMLSVFS